jgi:hypothetical protein
VSPVILLGLVVMWAVVLVPMWLKRHDEAEESRSVDRFTSAMHTLSRRETASDQRYVVMPHRSRSVDVHVSGAAPRSRRARRKALAARRASAKPPMTAAARRRRTLIGLLLVTILTFAAAMFVGGLKLWAPQLVLDAVLVGFVAHLVLRGRRAGAVHSVRAERPAHAEPAARRQPAPAARRRPDAAPAVEFVAPVRVTATAAGRQSLFDQTAAADVAERELEPAAAGFVFDQSAEIDLASAERAAASAAEHPTVELPAYESTIEFDEPEIEIGGRPWEPVPVPRPTYADKPTAPPRRPRAPIFEPLLPEAEIAAELDPLDDLEEILDRRWAVND